MLIVLSLAIAVVFTLISKDTARERARYFLTMILYMVVGSLVGSWLMSALPW